MKTILLISFVLAATAIAANNLIQIAPDSVEFITVNGQSWETDHYTIATTNDYVVELTTDNWATFTSVPLAYSTDPNVTIPPTIELSQSYPLDGLQGARVFQSAKGPKSKTGTSNDIRRNNQRRSLH